jgi:hypothetical protein
MSTALDGDYRLSWPESIHRGASVRVLVTTAEGRTYLDWLIHNYRAPDADRAAARQALLAWRPSPTASLPAPRRSLQVKMMSRRSVGRVTRRH